MGKHKTMEIENQEKQIDSIEKEHNGIYKLLQKSNFPEEDKIVIYLWIMENKEEIKTILKEELEMTKNEMIIALINCPDWEGSKNIEYLDKTYSKEQIQNSYEMIEDINYDKEEN